MVAGNKLFLEDCLDLTLRELIPRLQRRILTRTTYRGVPTQKLPLDLWVYQEIIHAMRPAFIFEIGCYAGGSTLALADMCSNAGCGVVIGIDRDLHLVPQVVRGHRRIRMVEGDAVEVADELIAPFIGSAAMVIEDSSHTLENTLAVLDAYAPVVGRGHYFIVEDTILALGLLQGPRPGPMEAVERFLEWNDDFEVDRDREDFVATWHPKGFLRRVKSPIHRRAREEGA